MTFRIPSSLNWLVEKYSRRKSRLESIDLQIEEYDAKIASLEKIKEELLVEAEALEKVIRMHEIPIEPSYIQAKRRNRKITKRKHGDLTKAIYKSLSPDEYKSTNDVFLLVVEELGIEFQDEISKKEFRLAVRYRLKNLRRIGKVEKSLKSCKERFAYWKLGHL